MQAPSREEADMEIVRLREVHELAAQDQKFCEAAKAWFHIDFVPKMSRVLLTQPEFGRPYGRASRRAMSDGALTRGQKELIATTVSAINVCEY
jgi:alkylhydroperoxidase family enzyme